jgi:aspartate racemase
VEALQRAGDWDAAGAELAREAGTLVAAGAELLVLCTNTMHRVAGAIEEAVDVPVVHIADATVPIFDTTRLHAQRAVELAL